MKYCIFVTIDFVRTTALLVNEIYARDTSSTFCALYDSTPNVINTYRSLLSGDFAPLRQTPSVNDLQREWVRTGDRSKLSYYEKLFGHRKLNHCLICDKELGQGYITGGDFDSTYLMLLTASQEAKETFLCGMLDFIFDYLQTESPDLIFFPTVERGFDVAFQYVAEHIGITFRKLSMPRLGDRFIIAAKSHEHFPHVKATFSRYLECSEMDATCVNNADNFIDTFREKPAAPGSKETVLEWLFSKMSIKTQLILLAQMLHPRYRSKGIHDFLPSRYLSMYYKRRFRTMVGYSKSKWLMLNDISDRTFVYFALHCDPEVSTMVCTPMQTDQLSIIEALSKSIPIGWNIAVKEHHSMIGRRPLSFYKRLRSIPKVKLIHPFENSFLLNKSAAFTATITGSVGFESMLLGKTPLYFGYTFTHDIGEGFVYCTDFERLPECVEQTLTTPPVPRSRLVLYIAALYKHSFDFSTRLTMESVFATPDVERAQYIGPLADALLKSLTWE